MWLWHGFEPSSARDKKKISKGLSSLNNKFIKELNLKKRKILLFWIFRQFLLKSHCWTWLSKNYIWKKKLLRITCELKYFLPEADLQPQKWRISPILPNQLHKSNFVPCLACAACASRHHPVRIIYIILRKILIITRMITAERRTRFTLDMKQMNK